jgi:hypothetical protein
MIKTITPAEAALKGAFLMDGVRDLHQGKLLEIWACGFYELVDYVVQFAEPLWTLAELGGEITGDFPGMFDYEVVTCIGTKIAEHIMETGQPPEVETVKGWCVHESSLFFLKSAGSPSETDLRAAFTLAMKGIIRG